MVYGATVTSDIELPGASRTFGSGGIVIARGLAFDGRPIEPFQERRGRGPRRGRPWLSIAREEGGYLLRFPDYADFVVSHGGERIVYCPRRRLATSTLSHLLLDHVLPLAVSRRVPLALHASAVHVPRLGTIAFVGPTGSGKSTLAAAMALTGCHLITDDCLVVNTRSRSIATPGYGGLRLLFDGGRLDAAGSQRPVLPGPELRGWRFVTEEEAAGLLPPVRYERLRWALRARERGAAFYLEAGAPV